MTDQTHPNSPRLHEDDMQHIADQVTEKLQSQQNQPQSTGQAVVQDIETMQNRLKTHHKIIYVSLVFSGVVLVWFGLWTLLVEWTFVHHHPSIALVAGIVLLALTGQFYKELA